MVKITSVFYVGCTFSCFTFRHLSGYALESAMVKFYLELLGSIVLVSAGATYAFNMLLFGLFPLSRYTDEAYYLKQSLVGLGIFVLGVLWIISIYKRAK